MFRFLGRRIHAAVAGLAPVASVCLVDGKIVDPQRVINSDECPNPWNATGGRTKFLGAVGEPCRRLISSAREHTSLDVCQ